MAKNAEIEILRAISILMVITAHVPFILAWESAYWWPVFRVANFWAGVDIFFAISGFVVTATLLRHIRSETPLIALKSFWIRRFFRLAPLSWMTLALSIVLAATWNGFGFFGSPQNNFYDAVAVVIYVQNWHFFQCLSAGWKTCGINLHFWSLSLEEQFYITLPLVFIFSRKWLAAICALLIVIQFPLYRPNTSWLWITRTDAISWGVLIALFSQHADYWRLAPTIFRHRHIGLLFAALAITAICFLSGGLIVSFYVGLIALLAGSLVWIASYDRGYLFRNAESQRLLLWIGKRSYAIYLFHSIAFRLVKEGSARYAGSAEAIRNSAHSVVILAGGLILTAAIAEIACRLIEAPFQTKGRAMAQRIVAPTTVAVPT